MLTVRLDEETEKQLADLLAQTEIKNKSELIKQLIRDRWLTLQVGKTVWERRGGHPQHLLQDAPPNLSDRETRKKATTKGSSEAIADYVLRNHSDR